MRMRMKRNQRASDDAKRERLLDIIIEQAEKATDLEVKNMLFCTASSLDRVYQEHANKMDLSKSAVFMGVQNMAALACFFFDLLLLHHPSNELREALLAIAEEISTDQD